MKVGCLGRGQAGNVVEGANTGSHFQGGRRVKVHETLKFMNFNPPRRPGGRREKWYIKFMNFTVKFMNFTTDDPKVHEPQSS